MEDLYLDAVWDKNPFKMYPISEEFGSVSIASPVRYHDIVALEMTSPDYLEAL